jgi:hypothetical protein
MSRDEHDEPPLPESIWETLRRDEPDDQKVQIAYLRFAARRQPLTSPLLLLRWLAAGFGAGWGVAFAATGDPLFGAGRLLNPPPELPVVDPGSLTPRSSLRANPRVQSAPTSTSQPVPIEPEAPVPATSSPAVSPGLQGVLGEPSAADPKWQRAAAALKVHDYEAAEHALRELEMSGTAGDRDAASLAVAQVLLTRGRSVEARARLEQLRTRALSPLVRSKAAALLASPAAAAERSFEPPPVTQ